MERDKIKHALRYGFLNFLYDPVTAFTCRERHFKTRMLELARGDIKNPILDVACGTGTFIKMIKNAYPDAGVTGLDADPVILRMAAAKTAGLGDVRYIEAFSQDTGLASGSIGTAFTSLFYHHLDHETKLATTREIHRVLRPGGAFIIADWGRPEGMFYNMGFFAVRLFDGFDTTQDNYEERIPEILKAAGFKNVKELERIGTMFGILKIWRGYR
jgi:ubiquinone/menaquinone biosynthesis C-methylase UbiE